MADPVLVACTEKQWTLVAENVVTGFLRKPLVGSNFEYFWTSRDTGEDAPTVDGDSGLALPLFEDGRNEEITSINNQDFYVWVVNTTPDIIEIAQIRVDL